jgi:hypothetical protein
MRGTVALRKVCPTHPAGAMEDEGVHARHHMACAQPTSPQHPIHIFRSTVHSFGSSPAYTLQWLPARFP